jgi:hypothetical protein
MDAVSQIVCLKGVQRELNVVGIVFHEQNLNLLITHVG